MAVVDKLRDNELKHEKALSADVAALRREGVSFLESDAAMAKETAKSKSPVRSFLPLMEPKNVDPVEEIADSAMKKLKHLEHLEYAKFKRKSKALGFDFDRRKDDDSLLQLRAQDAGEAPADA